MSDITASYSTFLTRSLLWRFYSQQNQDSLILGILPSFSVTLL